MKWRKLIYTSASKDKYSNDFVASDNYANDMVEAKKECKSYSRTFVRLSKTTYNTFGEKTK